MPLGLILIYKMHTIFFFFFRGGKNYKYAIIKTVSYLMVRNCKEFNITLCVILQIYGFLQVKTELRYNLQRKTFYLFYINVSSHFYYNLCTKGCSVAFTACIIMLDLSTF